MAPRHDGHPRRARPDGKPTTLRAQPPMTPPAASSPKTDPPERQRSHRRGQHHWIERFDVARARRAAAHVHRGYTGASAQQHRDARSATHVIEPGRRVGPRDIGDEISAGPGFDHTFQTASGRVCNILVIPGQARPDAQTDEPREIPEARQSSSPSSSVVPAPSRRRSPRRST